MSSITARGGFAAWLWEWTKSIAIALVVWFFLRTFLVEAFRIPSGSMERTLLVGDFLFVTKFLYGAEVPLIHKRLPKVRDPRLDDVVVFDSVEEDMKVVKRIVAMPGDTVGMERGLLVRNGQTIHEPWAIRTNPNASADPFQRERMRQWQLRYLVNRDPSTYYPDLQDWGPIVVPEGFYFMMGDNRDDSYDGRYWGFLPKENVRGTPWFVYFSYDASTYRPLPFFTSIRWGRIFDRPR